MAYMQQIETYLSGDLDYSHYMVCLRKKQMTYLAFVQSPNHGLIRKCFSYVLFLNLYLIFRVKPVPACTEAATSTYFLRYITLLTRALTFL